MENASSFPESPMEQDDVVYPCKGCGEILEEGKAFELAGNRWHIDCFRCNTCGTLLDSDANLLLLGDGSLICNNCTYSCSACGNKIEDLAILTGDQAFCASCFRCRNCKRKIENLRYARTSQGIFCMSCHESLMARRRKKSKANRQPRGADANGPLVLDKSLPALPPNALQSGTLQPNALHQPSATPDEETPPLDAYTETPTTDMSPPPRALRPAREFSSSSLQRDVDDDESLTENLTLPASTYDARHPATPQRADDATAEGDERFFIPLALDPRSALGPPASNNGIYNDDDIGEGTIKLRRKSSKREFLKSSNAIGSPGHRDVLGDSRENSRSSSVERNGRQAAAKTSPHIAFQEKGRQVSGDKADPVRRRKKSVDQSTPLSAAAAPAAVRDKARTQHLTSPALTLNDSVLEEAFKLGEVPKSKRLSHSRRTSKDTKKSPPVVSDTKESAVDRLAAVIPSSLEPLASQLNQRLLALNEDSKDVSPTPSPPPGTQAADLPKRDDSLGPPTSRKKLIQRKEIRSDPSTPTLASQQFPVRKSSTEPTAAASIASSTDSTLVNTEGGSAKSKASSVSAGSTETIAPPPRSAGRLGLSGLAAPPETSNSFTAPRAPPPPPQSDRRHKTNESISTLHSEHSRADYLPSSPLPRYSTGGDFSLEEDMARILRGDSTPGHTELQHTPSVLRRVSNAVKHGRSLSDRSHTRQGSATKWHHKSPGANGSIDISSPISAISEHQDEASQLKAQLRRAHQRIAELEADKHSLQENVNTSTDMKQVNTELREKRSTMAFLDTQREMVVRELEIMADRLAKAKDNNQPLDVRSMKTEMLKDFATAMQKLKESLGSQIEELIQKRNALTGEISNLIQMKDKGFQEFESLSSKNNQLAELNHQLVHNIQELYKANRQPNGSNALDSLRPTANGLGIYTNHQKESSDLPMDLHSALSSEGFPNVIMDNNEAGSATVVGAPQVVSIRKGQPKKFNWRKGGQVMAKNVTKGFKGAFVSENKERSTRDGQFTLEGLPYGMLPSDQAAKAAGFTPKGGGHLKPGQGPMGRSSGSTTDLTEDSIGLFGFDLQARCEYERRSIPMVVSRCIEEVELRGIDAEGIYRKSGGTGQVKLIQAGFEKHNDYDISDPDLDIHAVTSALKQYFRKLPTPLITFEVYDGLLHATHIDDREKRGHAMRDAVNELPRSHRECLEFLVFHLVRIMGREGENLMTPLNLAVVFAPTIMRPLSIEREMSDMQAQRNAVQSLLELHHLIFSGAAPGTTG